MIKIDELEKKEDPRGWLVEVFKEELSQGQVYVFTSKPGVIRGNHWHERKEEWFCCLYGRVKITLIDNKSKKQQVVEMDSGKGTTKLFIPAKTIHVVENIGDTDSCILAYINEKFNPKDPDTFYPDQTNPK